MRNSCCPPAALLWILQLAIPVPAQTPAPPATVLKVTTRLVQVNVVVHAKKNEPVTDLKKEDFVIYDQGQKQQIATFAIESAQPAGSGAQNAKLALPPNTFTNRTELRPARPKAVTVILLDGLNTRLEDQIYAKKQLISFLGQLHPDDSVALFTLGRNLIILHDFTSDASSLLRAVARHGGHIATELADSNPADPDTGNEDLDQFLAEADQKIADYQTIRRVETTLAALEAIANHVARLPGRKNLIWISGGFPFSIGLDGFNVSNTQEQRTFSDELERAARAVNAASLAIYPVDARGLIGSPDFSATTPGGKNARRPPTGPSKAMVAIQRTHDTMEMIADRTGGKAYLNSNDLKNAIRSAIDDARATYVLGYYPAHNTWDGAFHELKVQVERKGVSVRHRLGYFAFADQPQTPDDRQKALREAAWSPLDSTGIGLTLRLGPNLPKPGKLRVIGLLDIRNVRLEQKNDRWVGMLDILFAQQPAPDKPAQVLDQTLNLNLTKETYDAALKRGLLFGKDLELADAGYFLRVAVRDAGSGNVGSVNLRTDKLQPLPPDPAPAAK